jgi:hypothetical protein
VQALVEPATRRRMRASPLRSKASRRAEPGFGGRSQSLSHGRPDVCRLKRGTRLADFRAVPVRPFLWLAPVLAASAIALVAPPGDTGDLPYFVHAAERLFSAHWAETYANPMLQIGPLQLALFGAADLLAGALDVSTTRAIALVVGAGVAALFWITARRLLGPRSDPIVLLAAGLAPVALGLTFDAFRDGHPAQVVVPLLWVLAGFEARAGRAWRAGALVGLSAGFELWGLLGAAVLVVAPRAGQALRALAAALAVVAVLFAPFVLAGEFEMFEYEWQVNGDTLLSVFVDPGTTFAWPLRAIQGGTAVLAGAAVAWVLRRSIAALWAGPLALVVIRLALDPVRYPWYWLALETLVLLGVVQLASIRTRWPERGIAAANSPTDDSLDVASRPRRRNGRRPRVRLPGHRTSRGTVDHVAHAAERVHDRQHARDAEPADVHMEGRLGDARDDDGHVAAGS